MLLGVCESRANLLYSRLPSRAWLGRDFVLSLPAARWFLAGRSQSPAFLPTSMPQSWPLPIRYFHFRSDSSGECAAFIRFNGRVFHVDISEFGHRQSQL